MLWLVLTHAALADAIDPGPPCDEGSFPTSSHAGSWCSLDSCAGAAECSADRVCEERALCIVREQVECGGRSEFECVIDKVEVVAPCGEDGSCFRGTCETGPVCVPPPKVEQAIEQVTGSCGCVTVLPAAVGGLGLLPLLLGLRRER